MQGMRLLGSIIVGCLLAFGSPNVIAAAPADGASIATLLKLLDQPEGQIDLARAKVTIDHLVDPKVDVEVTLRLLDQWAAKVRARFPQGAMNKTKINLLVSTLYEPGPWNDYRPFGYDFSDPFGRDPKNTLLSTYLTKRKGSASSCRSLSSCWARSSACPSR